MNKYLTLGKYSFGMGDRFARQGTAQLQACALATKPSSLRLEADGAVRVIRWQKSYLKPLLLGS